MSGISCASGPRPSRPVPLHETRRVEHSCGPRVRGISGAWSPPGAHGTGGRCRRARGPAASSGETSSSGLRVTLVALGRRLGVGLLGELFLVALDAGDVERILGRRHLAHFGVSAFSGAVWQLPQVSTLSVEAAVRAGWVWWQVLHSATALTWAACGNSTAAFLATQSSIVTLSGGVAAPAMKVDPARMTSAARTNGMYLRISRPPLLQYSGS